MWKTVHLAVTGEEFLRQLRAVRPALEHLYAVHWCDAELCNGGFHQFYTNPTGVLAPEAADGFEAIGLTECAALVRKTMSFFGTPYPRDQVERIGRLEAVEGETREEWDPFFASDDAYYALVDAASLVLRNAADAYAERMGLGVQNGS